MELSALIRADSKRGLAQEIKRDDHKTDGDADEDESIVCTFMVACASALAPKTHNV